MLDRRIRPLALLVALAAPGCSAAFQQAADDQGSTGDDASVGPRFDATDERIVVGPPPLEDGGTGKVDSSVAEDASSDAAAQADGHDAGDASRDAGAPIDAAPTCSGAQKACGATCVAKSDPSTGCAGASCAPCSTPHATSACGANGSCAEGVCAPGYDDCDKDGGDGCETDLSKPATCGACSTTCPVAAPYCVATGQTFTCSTNCPVGTPTLCTGTCVDLFTNPAHCGTCTNACPVVTNGHATCASKTCGFACDGAYSPCNGGCVNYANDSANCGTCGHACPTVAHGSDTCVSSSCQLACDNGYQLCKGACVAADATNGVFVSPSSSATTGCGAIGAPCGTIAAGIAAAQSLGRTIVYLDQGTYAEQVTLVSGITIQGGWAYSGGGAWSKQCTGDASTLAILQPASGNVTVSASGVTATLDTLTVLSKATANAGESLYGVFATNGAKLTMYAVEVSVAAAGGGISRGAGTPPTGPVPPCAGQGGQPATTPGANGGVHGAVYTSAGYVPGNGDDASPGLTGEDGTAGGQPKCVTPAECDANSNTCGPGSTMVCGQPGNAGCGGPGGAPGLGGTGGGSSIGVYSWQATIQVNGGSLTSGAGGSQGAGAAGSSSPTAWPSMSGSRGTDASPLTCIQKPAMCGPGHLIASGGAPGGVGGQGSAGGAGASGSAGDSYSYYTGGGGAVTLAGGATTSFGSPGASAGPVPGPAGHAAAHN